MIKSASSAMTRTEAFLYETTGTEKQEFVRV